MKNRITALVLSFIVLMVTGAQARAQSGAGIDASVNTVLAGGNTVNGGGLTLDVAIGQPIGGQIVSGGTFIVLDGFTEPPCRADFNGNGVVSVQDIFDFLTAWFAKDPYADVNANGAITVQDIFDFLSAWFAGC